MTHKQLLDDMDLYPWSYNVVVKCQDSSGRTYLADVEDTHMEVESNRVVITCKERFFDSIDIGDVA